MNTSGPGDGGRLRQEAEGIRALSVGASLVGTFVFGALLVGAAYFWLQARERQARPSRVFDETNLRLQERVSGVLQEPFEIPGARPSERERQEGELRRFSWVDRSRRIVRIPIEQAMQLMARDHDGPPPGRSAGR
jgi:hypothetical protein